MIKNILKISGLERLIILFAMTFVIYCLPSEQASNIALKKQIMQKNTQRRKQEEGKYFIYERDTCDGVWVNAEETKKLSPVIANMTQDCEGGGKYIPVPFSVNTIKLGFDILNNKANNRLLQKLDVANFFDYLSISDNQWSKVLLSQLKKSIEYQSEIKSINECFGELKKLTSDLQKLFMTIPTINCLKTFMISVAKYNFVFKGRTVNSAIFIPGEFNTWLMRPRPVTEFAVGFASQLFSSEPNGIVLGEGNSVSNIHRNIKLGSVVSIAASPDCLVMVGESKNNLYTSSHGDWFNTNAHSGTIKSVAFLSPERIVLGCDGDQNNLKIYDPHKYKTIFNFTVPNAVNSVACSDVRNLIICGCNGQQDNLILCDMSSVNWNNPVIESIRMQDISDGSFYSVTSLALNHDGSKLVSGSKDGSLILWDINGSQGSYKVVKTLLAKHEVSVNCVAFSPDGQNILVGLSGSELNVELWDISDQKMITHNAFTGIPNDIYTVAFSPDNRRFLVGGKSSMFFPEQNTLLVWDNLTQQQSTLLNQLKQYDAHKLRLIYKLCVISLKGQTDKLKLDEEEEALFNSLEDAMKSLLRELNLVKK